MAKLATMFFVLIAIQAVLLMYGSSTVAETDIWTFITNMERWGSLTFILAVIGIAGGIGLTGIAAASTFGFKTDFLIFAPAVAGFISLGVVLTDLARFMNSQMTSYFFHCDPSLTGTTLVDGVATANLAYCLTSQTAIVNFIIALTIGPLAFYYMWTIVEWWRGKDY